MGFGDYDVCRPATFQLSCHHLVMNPKKKRYRNRWNSCPSAMQWQPRAHRSLNVIKSLVRNLQRVDSRGVVNLLPKDPFKRNWVREHLPLQNQKAPDYYLLHSLVMKGLRMSVRRTLWSVFYLEMRVLRIANLHQIAMMKILVSTSTKSLSSLSVGMLCQHIQRQHSGKRTWMTRKLPNRNVCMTIAKGPKRLCIQDRLQRVSTRRTELILKDCESCFLLLLVNVPLTAL